MGWLFEYVDEAPEAAAAPVATSGRGLFAAALGVVGFLAVAVIEGMAEQSANQDEGETDVLAPNRAPDAGDFTHDHWFEHYGSMRQ